MKKNKKIVVASIITGIMALIIGCADMPIIENSKEKSDRTPELVLGPYSTSDKNNIPVFRFVTNKSCTAGLQKLDANKNRMERQGSFNIFHKLQIPDLSSNERKKYRLWLDNYQAGDYMLKGLPKNNQAVRIALTGGKSDKQRLPKVGNIIRSKLPDAVIFTSSPFEKNMHENPKAWVTDFFTPLGNMAETGPLWFTPGANENLPEQLFPEDLKEGGYWKKEIGTLKIIGIDARALLFPSAKQNLFLRLEKDLDPLHQNKPWTIVVISAPLFEARTPNGAIVKELGDLLENGGVDLVISGGAEYYLRTKPFSANGLGQTHYVMIADKVSNFQENIVPREYVENISNLEHVAEIFADEGILEFSLIDLNGKNIDSLVINSSRQTTVPPIPKYAVLTDANAVATLQKELVRMVRQVAKAVDDINKPFLIPIYFANPTTKEFIGTLDWKIPEDTRWQVEPRTMPFTLQPGQAAVAKFLISPLNGNNLPILTADAVDIGIAKESLIITPDKKVNILFEEQNIKIDGRFQNKNYWKNSEKMYGFTNKYSGRSAKRQTEARIAADKDGLIIAVTMFADNAYASDPEASNTEKDHDKNITDDESIEIYIDPEGKGRDYYRFAVNVRNVSYDASSIDGVDYNPKWRHAVRFGRIDKKETWDAEIHIPWEAFGLAFPPKKGTEWGLEIVRNDFSDLRTNKGKEKTAPEISQWTKTFGTDTRSGLYGKIIFPEISVEKNKNNENIIDIEKTDAPIIPDI